MCVVKLVKPVICNKLHKVEGSCWERACASFLSDCSPSERYLFSFFYANL